jgi:uncharacterized delta-60 repeat protein
VDSTGRIVVAGNSNSGSDMVATAFRRDNTDAAAEDGSFNGSDTPGYVLSDDFSGGESFGTAVAVTAEDDVVFAGGEGSASDSTIAVWKWNNPPDDSADWHKKFDCGNSAHVGAGARAMAVDSSGRIVVAGVCVPKGDDSGLPTLVVMRLNDDGSLDQNFGQGEGMMFVHNFEHDNVEIEALDMAIDSQGRIVVTGSYLGDNQQLDMIVLRIKP